MTVQHLLEELARWEANTPQDGRVFVYHRSGNLPAVHFGKGAWRIVGEWIPQAGCACPHCDDPGLTYFLYEAPCKHLGTVQLLNDAAQLVDHDILLSPIGRTLVVESARPHGHYAETPILANQLMPHDRVVVARVVRDLLTPKDGGTQ